ncbi:MAG TPA: alpha/beta hydrolase [Anaeromyxobacteraceae bacterium]|nr:alpha/beta hydrolase [Anaeromyxobacteraceae bacterium]
MPTVRLGDATIHYREAGSGNEVVLLLHAFPLNSEMWTPQLSAMAARFRVIAPDCRGLGESRPAPAQATVGLMASDVLGLLRLLGIRRAAVAGLSMGGYVALELYRRAPELFRGLALCDTKASPDSEEQRSGREVYAQNALANGLAWVADDFAPKLLRKDAEPALLSAVKSIIAHGTPEGVAAAQRGLARRPDSVPTLSRITCPTIVIFGEDDQLVPFGEALRMGQTVKGARIARIPAAGHLPNLESPGAFNAALSTFFAALPVEKPVVEELTIG